MDASLGADRQIRRVDLAARKSEAERPALEPVQEISRNTAYELIAICSTMYGTPV
jgi:hypothetical protein